MASERDLAGRFNLEWAIGKCGFTSAQFESCLNFQLSALHGRGEMSPEGRRKVDEAIENVRRAVLPPIKRGDGDIDKRTAYAATMQVLGITPSPVTGQGPKKAEQNFDTMGEVQKMLFIPEGIQANENITFEGALQENYKSYQRKFFYLLNTNNVLTQDELKEIQICNKICFCNLVDDVTRVILREEYEKIDITPRFVTGAMVVGSDIRDLVESCQIVLAGRMYVERLYELPDNPTNYMFRSWKNHFWINITLGSLLVALELKHVRGTGNTGLTIACMK